jgi:hypoxanthine phosphoribosyltransferase
LDYLFITWGDLEGLVARLALAIRERGMEPDIIVGVSRGGLAPTRMLSDFLDIRDVIILGVAFYEEIGRAATRPVITHPLGKGIRGRRVVLLDDVSDTGGSLALAKEHLLSLGPSELLACTLHRKPWSTFDPDIFVEETDRWIIYPWEKGEAASHILGKMRGSESDLLDVGFSGHDLRILRSLGFLPSDPDSPRGENDHAREDDRKGDQP